MPFTVSSSLNCGDDSNNSSSCCSCDCTFVTVVILQPHSPTLTKSIQGYKEAARLGETGFKVRFISPQSVLLNIHHIVVVFWILDSLNPGTMHRGTSFLMGQFFQIIFLNSFDVCFLKTCWYVT